MSVFSLYILVFDMFTVLSSSAVTNDNKKLPQRGLHGKDGAYGELTEVTRASFAHLYYFSFTLIFTHTHQQSCL